MSIGREDIVRRLPHGPAMVLLDHVESWDDDGITCLATSHRRHDNPLRRRGRLAVLSGVEYAAQAAALHGALTGARDGSAGAVLGSVGNVRTSRARLDGVEGELRVVVRILHAQANGAAYSFSVGPVSGPTSVEGRFTVMYR